MWINLDKEDKDFLINAFKADGFKVHSQSTEMVAEKNGQKIIVRDPMEAEIVWDIKKTFEEKKILTNRIGKIPVEAVVDFLRKEKKEKESLFSTLKRTHEKFNWAIGLYGDRHLDFEWKSLGDQVSFALIHTDQDDQSCLVVSFISERKGERLYFLNMDYFPFVKFLDSYSPLQEFKDLAPNAYMKLKAYTNE